MGVFLVFGDSENSFGCVRKRGVRMGGGCFLVLYGAFFIGYEGSSVKKL